jgi:hypothetical protein
MKFKEKACNYSRRIWKGSGNLIEVFGRVRASRAAPCIRQLSPSPIQSSGELGWSTVRLETASRSLPRAGCHSEKEMDMDLRLRGNQGRRAKARRAIGHSVECAAHPLGSGEPALCHCGRATGITKKEFPRWGPRGHSSAHRDKVAGYYGAGCRPGQGT